MLQIYNKIDLKILLLVAQMAQKEIMNSLVQSPGLFFYLLHFINSHPSRLK